MDLAEDEMELAKNEKDIAEKAKKQANFEIFPFFIRNGLNIQKLFGSSAFAQIMEKYKLQPFIPYCNNDHRIYYQANELTSDLQTHFFKTSKYMRDPDKPKKKLWESVIKTLSNPICSERHNTDKRTCFMFGVHFFLVKSAFTTGLRIVADGTAHVYQIGSKKLDLYFLDETAAIKLDLDTQPSRWLKASSQFAFKKIRMRPDCCYRIPEKTHYVVIATDRSYFSTYVIMKDDDLNFESINPFEQLPQTAPPPVDLLYQEPVGTPYIEHYKVEKTQKIFSFKRPKRLEKYQGMLHPYTTRPRRSRPSATITRPSDEPSTTEVEHDTTPIESPSQSSDLTDVGMKVNLLISETVSTSMDQPSVLETAFAPAHQPSTLEPVFAPAHQPSTLEPVFAPAHQPSTLEPVFPPTHQPSTTETPSTPAHLPSTTETPSTPVDNYLYLQLNTGEQMVLLPPSSLELQRKINVVSPENIRWYQAQFKPKIMEDPKIKLPSFNTFSIQQTNPLDLSRSAPLPLNLTTSSRSKPVEPPILIDLEPPEESHSNDPSCHASQPLQSHTMSVDPEPPITIHSQSLASTHLPPSANLPEWDPVSMDTSSANLPEWDPASVETQQPPSANLPEWVPASRDPPSADLAERESISMDPPSADLPEWDPVSRDPPSAVHFQSSTDPPSAVHFQSSTDSLQLFEKQPENMTTPQQLFPEPDTHSQRPLNVLQETQAATNHNNSSNLDSMLASLKAISELSDYRYSQQASPLFFP